MNALQQRRTACIILLIALSSHPACAFPVTFSDQGTDAKSGGVLVDGGDLTVQVWDSMTGGSMLYGETFDGAIVNGSWNVILGGLGDLELEYGLTYYKEYQINGQDLDFTTPSTGTTERLPFTSPLGAVNMSKLTQVPNKPNIDASNVTSGIIPNARLNASYVLNQTFAAASYSPLAHTHVSTYLNYSGTCASGQIYEWGVGCVSMPSGGAAQPNLDAANITAGTILNARYNMSFLAQASDVTGLWGNASNQDARIISLESAPGGATQPNVDAANITSGTILNARYNLTFLMNYTACGASQYWVFGLGCTAIPSGGAAQPNVDAANVTSGTVLNARYNMSFLAQAVNVTDMWANASDQQGHISGLWGNASNQDARIIALETAPGGASQPNVDAANITSGTILNARYNMTYLAQAVNITDLWVNATVQESNIGLLWANASSQEGRITVLEAAPGGAVEPSIDAANITSGVIANARYNASYILNRSGALTDTKYCTYNASSGAIDCNSDASGNVVDASNITQLWGNMSAAVANVTALYENVTWLKDNATEQRVLIQDLWSNATNQDLRIISLENAPASQPYWINLSGSITSNASINGGSVHVRGNISSGTSNASGLFTAAFGSANIANGSYSAVSGGSGSVASGPWSSVSGGANNIADNNFAAVSGGQNNIAGGWHSVVSGGADNNASGSVSAVSGGRYNTATGTYAFVSGGFGNIAGGNYSIAGGSRSNATGQYSVSFGLNISASASNSFAFGQHYTNPSPDTFTVGFTDITLNVSDNLVRVAGDLNATGVVCDGAGNCLNNVGSASVVPYWANLFGSITSNSSLSGGSVNVTGNLKVMGRIAGNGSSAAGSNAVALGFHSSASGDQAVVAGGFMNNASGLGSVVSGGEYNAALGSLAVVAGGYGNDANGSNSVVSGGEVNTASGHFSVVSGGYGNVAGGVYSVVSGGNLNIATGNYSVILGGTMNTASGNYSIAGGNRSNATWTNSVALGNGALASGRSSYSLGENTHATAGNSYAFGRDVYSTNAGAISFGYGFTNPVPYSFAVGFGNITLNVTGQLLQVSGDINATGRVCDGAGNCIAAAGMGAVTEENITALWVNATVQESHIGLLWFNATVQEGRLNALESAAGGAAQPNIDAANVTSGVIANARYNASYLFNKSGGLTDGQYCRYNGSVGTIDCNSPGTGSATVTDQNVTDLWENASVQESHIRALFAANSSLWANASNQEQRITSLEGASGSTPYWVTRNSVTSSNWTLNGGNVNVTGSLQAANISTHSSTAIGQYSAAFGLDAHATGDYSMAAGSNIDATGVNSYAFGRDFSNAEARTFKVGWESTPTLVVNETQVGVDGDVWAAGVYKNSVSIVHATDAISGTTVCNYLDSIVPGYDYACYDCITFGGAASDCTTTSGDRHCACQAS